MYDLEAIRDASPIEEIIGVDVELRKRGRCLVGLCPFHADRNPSFSVSPGWKTFRCWGCDAGGDVFAYLMRRDGLSFLQALRTLAERAGLDFEPIISSGNDSPTARSHPWPPTPAGRRQMDRDLVEAYTEVELGLAGSLRQRWTEAVRKLHGAGVDPKHVTPADWGDMAKMEALADYYAAMDSIAEDEHVLEQIAHRSRNT